MRVQCLGGLLCGLVSMALVLVILGQHQVLTRLKDASENMQLQSKRLDDQLSGLETFDITTEKLLVQGKKVLKDLEAEIVRLAPEMERKKKETDACEAEKSKTNDELAGLEKEHTDTEANSKSESDTWNQEISNLRAQLVGYRPICDHVKKDSQAVKLCGAKAEPMLKEVKEVKG